VFLGPDSKNINILMTKKISIKSKKGRKKDGEKDI